MLKVEKKYKKYIAIILSLLIIIIGIFTTGRVNYISEIVEEYEKNRILNTVKDYDVLETEKYIIRYKEDIQVANITSDILDKYYEQVCSMFSYYPKEKINIIIYNDGDKLLENTRLKKKNPPLGVYYGEIINVLSPRKWISPNENFQQIYEKKGPVVHEFTHLIIDNITNGNYPIWLTEGLALYTEYLTTGFEWGRYVSEHENITIDDLNDRFHEIDARLSYRKSFEIVRNISENWGFDKLILLLNTLGEGNSMGKSTETVLKVSVKNIEKNFLKE